MRQSSMNRKYLRFSSLALAANAWLLYGTDYLIGYLFESNVCFISFSFIFVVCLLREIYRHVDAHRLSNKLRYPDGPLGEAKKSRLSWYINNGYGDAWDRGLALKGAAKNGHSEVVRFLLADDADRVERGEAGIFVFYRGEALGWAADHDHSEVVRLLLSDDAARDEAGISVFHRGEALRFAARGGHLEVVQFLLGDDADRAPGDRILAHHRDPALGWAAKNGHLEVARFLLADDEARVEGDHISVWNRGYALRLAAIERHLGVVRFLLENDAARVEDDRISGEDRGWTLEGAAARGHLEVVQALLADDAARVEDDRISGEDRGLVLQGAAEHVRLEVVRALLADDADRAPGDRILAEDRGMALWDAAKGGHLEVVRFLLENDAARVEGDRISVFHRGLGLRFSADRGHSEVVQFLLENDAARVEGDRISVFHRGIALWNAARDGHSEVVQFLLENDAARVEGDRISAEDRGLALIDLINLLEENPIKASICVRSLLEGGEDSAGQLETALRSNEFVGMDDNAKLAMLARSGDPYIMGLLVDEHSALGRFIQASSTRSMISSYREAGKLLTADVALEEIFRVYLSAFRSRVEAERPGYERTYAALYTTSIKTPSAKNPSPSAQASTWSAMVRYRFVCSLIVECLGPTSDNAALGGAHFHGKKGSLWQRGENPSGAAGAAGAGEGDEDPVEYRGLRV